MSADRPASPGGDSARFGWLLALVTVLTFSPAFTAGWLDYDDDWLIQHNPVLSQPGVAALSVIFGGFDLEGRLSVGAEFLPVRDLLVWLLYGVLGVGVSTLHVVQLGIYVGAVVLFRRALLAMFGGSLRVEAAALLFAVHPLHAESVIWLAGIKDVLALLFTGAALASYARGGGRGVWVIVATFLACFSKGVSVVLPLLLLAVDYVMLRRPRWGVVAGVLTVSVVAAATHAWVGGIVGMVAEPIGGSRWVTLSSMLVVGVRYLGLAFFAHPYSVIYEVAPLGFSSALVWASLAALLTLGAAAVIAHRRGARWLMWCALLFAIALAPVSQVLAPLQNRMADRYMMVAVLGPMLALAFGACALLDRDNLARLRMPVVTLLVVVVAALGFFRASAYADAGLLFAEATEETVHNAVAPYQLALTYERRGNASKAEQFYRLAYARDRAATEVGCSAGNNLGRLLYRQNRVLEALSLYRELRTPCSNEPRVLRNLALVLQTVGQVRESEALMIELHQRFPRYESERGVERHGPQPQR